MTVRKRLNSQITIDGMSSSNYAVDSYRKQRYGEQESKYHSNQLDDELSVRR